MDPVYFPSPAAFRAWLEAHHAGADELWVGYHKRGTGTPSMTWPESVDEALCFGWIDGVRRSVDAERYAIRFTPRRPGSNWSRVNLARVEALTAEGRMRPAGIAAHQARKATPTNPASRTGRRSCPGPTPLPSASAIRPPGISSRRSRARTGAWRSAGSWPRSARRPGCGGSSRSSRRRRRAGGGSRGRPGA